MNTIVPVTGGQLQGAAAGKFWFAIQLLRCNNSGPDLMPPFRQASGLEPSRTKSFRWLPVSRVQASCRER